MRKRVDDLALLVHHLVVLEDVLADLGVAGLDGVLRLLHRLRDHLRLERHVVGERLAHHPRHGAGGEQAHELVLERQVEAALAGIALAAATGRAAGCRCGVTRGARCRARRGRRARAPCRPRPCTRPRAWRAAPRSGRGPPRCSGSRPSAARSRLGEALGVAAEDDVDAAAGHVRGDGDGVQPAGLGDDVGLAEVLLRVEHLVGDAPLLEQAGELLGLLDRDRADEHGLALRVALDEVLDDGVELGVLGAVDDVGLVEADARLVRRDRHRLQVVGVGELGGLGGGRAGHAGELLVEAEVVLERDRGEGLVLLLDPHALLGLDRLVQALGPAPALEDAAGELVDDLHLAVGDDVVLVAAVQLLGLERGLELVHEVLGDAVVEVLDAERLLDLLDALLEREDDALLLVDLVVDVALQAADDRGEPVVELGGVGDPAGDDQRRAGLVDEDRVDLVDDGVDVAPLGLLRQLRDHVVAEVVEAELVVRAVGDVAGVLRPLLGRRSCSCPGTIRPTFRPRKLVDAAHPLGVEATPGSR